MAENIENNGCSQRDSAEHEGYAKASRSFNRIWKERDSAQPRLLETILHKDNLNRAYKRVKANKGAPGLEWVYLNTMHVWRQIAEKDIGSAPTSQLFSEPCQKKD